MIMIWFGSEIDSNPPVSVDLAYILIDCYEVKVLVCFVDLEIVMFQLPIRISCELENSIPVFEPLLLVEVIYLLGFKCSRIQALSIYMCVPLFLNWKHGLVDLSILIWFVFSVLLKTFRWFKNFSWDACVVACVSDSLGVWWLMIFEFQYLNSPFCFPYPLCASFQIFMSFQKSWYILLVLTGPVLILFISMLSLWF